MRDAGLGGLRLELDTCLKSFRGEACRERNAHASRSRGTDQPDLFAKPALPATMHGRVGAADVTVRCTSNRCGISPCLERRK